MSSWRYTIDTSREREKLDPLLPQVAGVIENSSEASLSEIKRQVETDLERKVSVTEIVKALENGIRLGVFNVKREYKVCREFTTKELKREKKFGGEMMCGMEGNTGRNLMEYVKNQRVRRRQKLHSKKKKFGMSYGSGIQGDDKLYQYLCRKCKRSLERETARREMIETSSEDEEMDRKSRRTERSWTSSSSSENLRGKRSGSEEKPPEKSRLLVERNPMETDPPYYDIFT